MGALGDLINKMAEGWKSLSSGRKVGIIVLSSGVVTALIFFVLFLTKPQYEPLYLNMPPEDMAKVVEKLKQDKIDYKPSGTTILVPKEKVEELRLSVASSGIMPSSGKGFELFDESRFGITDTETKILYQRALEGELQRTIKGFDQIEQAVVHLVLPESSPFIRDEELARASVTLKLKYNKVLLPEQVKAIVALVSGSVKNLPEKNVVVVDNNFNYLSQNLYNDDLTSTISQGSRQEVVRDFEGKLTTELKKMLEAVFGPDKVRVSVNADLDFDSKQTTSLIYNTEGIIKSQNTIKETIKGTGGTTSSSPIDNNTSNVVEGGSSGTTDKSHEETSTDYNVGHIEERVIKAPGQVKKISTSVVIDTSLRPLSEVVKQSVTNLVKSSMGYDFERGDLISVEGMAFDDSMQKKIEADLKAIADKELADEKSRKLLLYIGIPAGAIIGLILLIIISSRLRAAAKRRKEKRKVDVVINEPIAVNEIIKKQSILDDVDDTESLSSEIRRYANKKPDQIVEIVKAWLAEDER